MEQVQKKNILGTEPIGGLLRQFAVPSIIAMLVGALYNIVDQFLSEEAWESWVMQRRTWRFR